MASINRNMVFITIAVALWVNGFIDLETLIAVLLFALENNTGDNAHNE